MSCGNIRPQTGRNKVHSKFDVNDATPRCEHYCKFMHDVEHSVGRGSCRIMLKAYDGNNSSSLLGSVLRSSGVSKPISDSRRRNLLKEVSTGCFAIFQENIGARPSASVRRLLCSFPKLSVDAIWFLFEKYGRPRGRRGASLGRGSCEVG